MGSENYYIGKGVLSIATWVNSAVPPTYVAVGNAPKFEFEMTESTLEHFSSQSGTKEQDAEITIQQGYNLSFTLDEVSVNNLKMFMRATQDGKNLYANMQPTGGYYALKFVTANPTGKQHTTEFWKCKITPSGAFSLVSDEFTTLNFTGKGMSDRANHAVSPFFTTAVVTTTTTTTTA